jgi:hypothetical protein
MSTLAFCVILPYAAHTSDCTASAKSRHLLQKQQAILRAVEQSCAVSVNAAIIYVAPVLHFCSNKQTDTSVAALVLHHCSIKQSDTSVVGWQVLRDLGISEARLQNGLVEVWNKTDLLPSAPPADSHAQLQPTCEAAREPASTGAELDYEMCKHLRKDMCSRMLVYTHCHTCNLLHMHLCLLL